MADRLDYHFRQRVTEAELDLGFELLERADRNFAADIGVVGIIHGAVPAPHAPVPDLSIDLTAPCRAYDRLGRRIFIATAQTVNCAVDFAGIPTEVSASDRERWLGVFMRFDRRLSDPRTDGNSQQVFFRRDEAFELLVRQSPEGPLGAAPKVPLQERELLLCDVRRTAGQGQILSADIDTSRRQDFTFAPGTSVAILSALWSVLQPSLPNVQSALDAVDHELAQHFGATGRRHGAAHVDYAPHGFLVADTVQAAVDELVDKLVSSAQGEPGASRVGAAGVAGAPTTLPPGTVGAQLAQLLAALNAHVGATSNAHAAAALAATPHAYVDAVTVQGQLQGIVSGLQSTAVGLGAGQVGNAAMSGSPHAAAAGTVRSHLGQLLSLVNGHAGLLQALMRVASNERVLPGAAFTGDSSTQVAGAGITRLNGASTSADLALDLPVGAMLHELQVSLLPQGVGVSLQLRVFGRKIDNPGSPFPVAGPVTSTGTSPQVLSLTNIEEEIDGTAAYYALVSGTDNASSVLFAARVVCR